MATIKKVVKKAIKKYEDGGPVTTTSQTSKYPSLPQNNSTIGMTTKEIAAAKAAKALGTKPTKMKMKSGGSLSSIDKTSSKRIGPVDPNGAFTKVQKKTLSGAKGKISLTKDKQLGATKMAKCGTCMSKKKK